MMDQTNKEFDVNEVFAYLKQISKQRKFSESLELILKLNVDPTQGDQNVRGTCILPCGTGKEVKVCVFADKEFHEQLQAEGCDVIGDDELLRKIGDGQPLNFDKIIATQEFM